MGDRANVQIKSIGSGSVFLYTHWGATELPQTLQKALKRNERWDDPSYLARIIFCEMIGGDVSGETGFGISGKVDDGADKVIVVDTDQRTVSWDGKSLSFEKYCSKPAKW